ncbi:MAG: carotenoid oxygenase family protein [Gammaproteobacteria bacterium]
MARFPDTLAFQGILRPLRFEGDILDLEVEGEVPAQLNGTYHRVHPDQQFAPRFDNEQFFNGDGMVSLFRFRNGKVDFKQRYAQTDKFKLERAAGRALFGAYRNPLTDEEAVKGRIRGTANTNVIVHHGKLLALKEDSPALVMDPLTLETQGYTNWNGKCTSQTFTAHPKIDPLTGNLIAFSYASKGLLTKDCTYMEISPTGELLREVWFEAPYYCMMHDWGVTEDYACFHIVPSTSNWERLQANLPHFGFDTTLPVYLLVLPRKGDAKDIKIFKRPNLFCSHVVNAFNDGTKIYFDTPVAKNNMFPFFPDIHGAPFDRDAAKSYVTRWTVDYASKGDEFEKDEQLSHIVSEFPRIDDRYATQPHGHSWMPVMDPTMPFNGPSARASGLRLNKLGHMNFRNGTESTWFCGPDSLIQEPCFIPRTPTAPEGDGYIVALVDDIIRNYSDLVMLDAQNVEAGPIARIKLPFRLRQGLHGNWADESKLPK